MKKQLAMAAFLVLSVCAIFSMKEPTGTGASQRIILAGTGCPTPVVPLAGGN